jgi:biotin carboxyl carrier protein
VEYNLKVANHHVPADVEIQDDRNLTAKVDQNLYDVNYDIISDHLIHMAVNIGDKEILVNAYVSLCSEGKNILVNGRQYLVCDLELDGKKIKRGISPDLPDQITPPMPAVVVRIPVQVGDVVKKGQGVIVVSAMKMETTLCAPFDGTVVKINCAINDKVSPGQILAEIKKEGDMQYE